MSFLPKSLKTARILLSIFLCTTVLLAGTLLGGWLYVRRLMLTPIPFDVPQPEKQARSASEPVSPLLLHYQMDLPGRGEIFPALSSGNAADYWPVAILTISNQADRPVLQRVHAEVPGWTRVLDQTLILGAKETRSLRLNPELLPVAYNNAEIHHSVLHVRVEDPVGAVAFAQDRPVLLHSASDLFWGNKFANAQFVARWVTPHDPAILKLVAEARRNVPNGRMPGYNVPRPGASQKTVAAQVRMQAQAVFEALRHSGISYVSSIYTFGNFVGEAQRIRLPRETLNVNSANCIDISVAFASAMENLGMNPVVVIVPGHAWAGVRLGPQTQDVLYLDLTVLPRGTFLQAQQRAQGWLRNTPSNQVLTVDVSAARMLGVYPMPTEPAPPSAAVAMSAGAAQIEH
jgi:hypothetical protein